VSAEPAFLRAALDIESEICVPILKENTVLGILNVEAAPGHPLTEDDVTVLNTLVGPVVIAIENARLHAEVKKLAMTDGLTELLNRRSLDLMLENELDRAARYNNQFSLIMIDIDSFKDFNNQWGHPAGDKRLKEVAELLRSSLRSPDFVARYGGEEFVVILPYTAKANAILLAERLRIAAEKCAPRRAQGQSLIAGYTFSMGIATYPEDGRNSEELLFRADQAELSAKRLGKNRICSA
jgi:diguanylate cyclase (GGDEF)-like protein